MPLKIYAGDTSQHAQVVAELTGTLGQAITDGQSGIFVVGGGPMVGKSSAVGKVLEKLRIEPNGVSISPLSDVYVDDVNPAGNLARMFNLARESGQKIFVLGEISIRYTKTLYWLAEFYNKCLTDGHGPLQLIFNVLVS